jgi:hypothetical protein
LLAGPKGGAAVPAARGLSRLDAHASLRDSNPFVIARL